MTNVRRLNCTVGDKRGENGDCMERHPEGRYVSYGAYAESQKHIQRLTDKVGRLRDTIEGIQAEIHPLRAESARRLKLLNEVQKERDYLEGMYLEAIGWGYEDWPEGAQTIREIPRLRLWGYFNDEGQWHDPDVGRFTEDGREGWVVRHTKPKGGAA